MKNLAKSITVLVFGVTAVSLVLISACTSQDGGAILSQVAVTPSPTVATAANAAVNASPPIASEPGSVPDQVLGQSIKKKFILGKDSLSEYGESPFDHASHALQKYSPDGNSVVACVECHHTDQPKAALKPPLLTSEREVALTLDTWKTTKQKVSECRACHFQEGDVPEGKEMPTASYTEAGKTTVKNLNNELAYHINCNTCHDASFKLRPTLKSKPGFATSKDCATCHVVTK